MKKIYKLLKSTLIVFILMVLFILPVSADVILPINKLPICKLGESPEIDNCVYSRSGMFFSETYDQKTVYLVATIVIVVVTAVSIIALVKIRRKNDN